VKRGRRPLPPGQKRATAIHVRVTVRLAEDLYAFAGRRRTSLSALTRRYFERLLERERELLSH